MPLATPKPSCEWHAATSPQPRRKASARGRRWPEKRCGRRWRPHNAQGRPAALSTLRRESDDGDFFVLSCVDFPSRNSLTATGIPSPRERRAGGSLFRLEHLGKILKKSLATWQPERADKRPMTDREPSPRSSSTVRRDTSPVSGSTATISLPALQRVKELAFSLGL